MQKIKHRRIQGLSKSFGYSLLSQERVKLRTSNLACTFTGPIRIPNKSPLTFLEKRERGRIQGLPKFLLLAVAISFETSDQNHYVCVCSPPMAFHRHRNRWLWTNRFFFWKFGCEHAMRTQRLWPASVVSVMLCYATLTTCLNKTINWNYVTSATPTGSLQLVPVTLIKVI